MRVSYDIDLVIRIAENNLHLDFRTWQKVLLGINRLVLPLKGFLDALCFCFISKWFWKWAKQTCCCIITSTTPEGRKSTQISLASFDDKDDDGRPLIK